MRAPLAAAIAVSSLEFGLVSSYKEFTAVAAATSKARSLYQDNELVESLLGELLEKQQGSATGAPPSDDERPSVDRALALIQNAARVADAKAPAEEARGYKSFVYALAEVAANASGDGLFGRGEKLSAKERAYLDRLKGTLAL